VCSRGSRPSRLLPVPVAPSCSPRCCVGTNPRLPTPDSRLHPPDFPLILGFLPVESGISGVALRPAMINGKCVWNNKDVVRQRDTPVKGENFVILVSKSDERD